MQLSAPIEELQDVIGILESKDWIFAKTMADNPHWYSLRWQWSDDADFRRVLAAIRAHGETELFRGSKYKVLIVNGWKYWAMPGMRPPPQPFKRWDIVIINRRTFPEELAKPLGLRGLFDGSAK